MLKVKNRLLIFGIIFVFVVSFVLRYKVLFNGFVLDDFILIVNNSFISTFSNILDVLNPKNLFNVLPIRCGARPFTIASLIIDYRLFCLSAFGYHFINLFLHSINCILVFLFCYFFKTNSKTFPFVVALFFSLHPIQTEVISAVCFRADLLLSMFSLIALNLINFFDNKNFLRNKKFLCLLIFCFVCFAFFSKENAIVLPFIIFLYVFFFYKDIKLIKFSVITIISVIFLFFFFWIERFPVPLYFSIYNSLPINTTPLSSILNYVYTLFTALFYNIVHIIYPINLSVDYTVIFSKYIFILILVFVVALFLSIKYVKDKHIKFSILAIICAYLPVSNVIPLINTIADRYMYYPMIFISILFGLLVIKLQKSINPKLLMVFIIILFIINTAISYDRAIIYNNQYSLYLDAINKNPNHSRVLYNMAIAYYDNKEYENSLELLNKLSNINPSYNRELVWFITGKNYESLNDKETAKKYYMKAFILSQNNEEFLDKFISMFPSVDNALYYILQNTKSLDNEIILTFQQYQKSKNTVEVK